MADRPEYLICLDCETPCYSFEWKDGDVTEVFCEACGADTPEEFMTEDDFEGMVSAEGSDGGGH